MQLKSSQFEILLVVIFVIGGTVGALPAQNQQKPDQLLLLDGRRVDAQIVAIDAAGNLKATPLSAPLNLMGLRSIQRPVKRGKPAQVPAGQLHLVGGGVLNCASIKTSGETLVGKWKYGPDFRFPFSAARAINFSAISDQSVKGKDAAPKDAPSRNDRPPRTPQGEGMFGRAIESDDRADDRMLFVVNHKVQEVKGLLESITDADVMFEIQGEVRRVSRKIVYGLVLAEIGRPHDPTGECLLQLVDGSSISGRIKKMADGQIEIGPRGGSLVMIPWTDVLGFSVRSDRMQFLSDLKPSKVNQRPILIPTKPWRKDENVRGGPLRLGNTRYEKGLGVQSYCELEYVLNPRFDTLSAVIGIDQATRGQGDCLFVVRSDDKELFRGRVRKSDAPREIRVKLNGAKKVTLIVEPGEGYDLADHANWCDARFLRSGDK